MKILFRLSRALGGASSMSLSLGLTLAACTDGSAADASTDDEAGSEATDSQDPSTDTDAGTDTETDGSTDGESTAEGSTEAGETDTDTSTETETDTETEGSTETGEPPAADGPFVAVRLNGGEPIISRQMFIDAGLDGGGNSNADKYLGGQNINGPSLIRVPPWIDEADKPDPSAQYYLYFASHYGRYIRMAWAADIEGPYHLYNTEDGPDGYGVLDVTSEVVFTNGNQLNPSDCASPDVVVDAENERVLLFFHVNNSTGKPESVDGDKWFDTWYQVSYVASSRTGLNFNGGDEVASGLAGEPGQDASGASYGVKQQALANAYMRTFIVDETWYAFTNYGPIWKGPSTSEAPWSGPWTHVEWAEGVVEGGGNPVWDDLRANFGAVGAAAPRWYAGFDGSEPAPYGENEPRTGAPRHFAVRWQSDGATLEVYYTSRGEMPESIYATTMDTAASPDYAQWDTAVLDDDPRGWVHQRLLFPEQDWEGANLEPTISKNGAESEVNALRDPYVFEDEDAQIYLLYSGGPEAAIGLARLEPR